jgi:Rrf2 family transcriptional regulator, nitric oxide-sensitive transcriptional repressor
VQLTTFTDYSLRVLISVAARDSDELATIPEIAARYGISRNHLIKVVHYLSRCGYIETVRGKGGGFRLAKPADRIGVGEVIRATESNLGIVPCMDTSGGSPCVIEPACVLKRALQEALKAFLEVTDRYTLADLVRPRNRLRKLLAVSA